MKAKLLTRNIKAFQGDKAKRIPFLHDEVSVNASYGLVMFALVRRDWPMSIARGKGYCFHAFDVATQSARD